MAEEVDPIVITTKDSDLDRTTGKFRTAAKTVEDMGHRTGKATEAARLGYWTMGEAAETAAQQIGIPNQAARQMGNAVESLAGKMGKFAVGFGIAGLAVAAGVSVWKSYREEQVKARESLIKLGDASASWVEGALKEQAQTKELIEAKKELREYEYNTNKERLEDAIPAQKEIVEGFRKQHLEAVQLRDRLSGHSDAGQSFLSSMIHGRSSDRQKAVEDIRKKFGEADNELKKLEAAYARLTGKGAKERYLTTDNDPEKLALEIKAALYKDNQKMLADSLVAQQNYNVSSAALTQQRIDMDRMESESKREALINTSGFMAQSFQAMYQAGGAHARKSFSLFKIAASAEALMNADRAAASSYAWGSQLGGPVLGGIMAGVAYLAGMARVKSIRSMELGSTGGAGGSVPTFSASPTTGAPTGSGGGPTSITININGQKAAGVELAGNILKTIYNNNGSVDGFTLAVERSA